jgi:hypothetical protein
MVSRIFELFVVASLTATAVRAGLIYSKGGRSCDHYACTRADGELCEDDRYSARCDHRCEHPTGFVFSRAGSETGEARLITSEECCKDCCTPVADSDGDD